MVFTVISKVNVILAVSVQRRLIRIIAIVSYYYYIDSNYLRGVQYPCH